jgi:MerR family redox-sensitive transcriptional activator SoxR
MDKSDLLSVGEVAKRSGLPVSTLHFYEAKGLIGSVRSEGNQRRFHRSELRRIAVVKVAQRAGIPLVEIKNALSSLPTNRVITGADWERLSKRWKAELEARIARLEALRDQLGDCIGCGCLSLKSCPLRNPDDVMSRYGSGPQFIEDE